LTPFRAEPIIARPSIATDNPGECFREQFFDNRCTTGESKKEHRGNGGNSDPEPARLVPFWPGGFIDIGDRLFQNGSRHFSDGGFQRRAHALFKGNNRSIAEV